MVRWLCMWALVACNPDGRVRSGTQIGAEEGAFCEEVSVDLVASDEVADGFLTSPSEHVAALTGSWEGTWDGVDGASAPARLSFASPDEVYWVQTEYHPSTSGTEADVECDDRYRMPVDVTVSLEGLPELSFPLDLDSAAGIRAQWTHRRPWTSDYPAPSMTIDDDDTVEVLVTAESYGDGWTGYVALGVERRHGNDGGDGAVSYTQVHIGNFVTTFPTL